MSQPMDVIIYTATDLQASQSLLHEIVRAINLAFTKETALKCTEPRFISDDQLLSTLGPDGLCAVARSNTGIMASASVVPWQPSSGGVVDWALRDSRPSDAALVDRGLSYELKAVITANTPESRGKGLVDLCTNALVSRLKQRHDDPDALLLWIQLAETENGAYWHRRGYEQVGPVEMKPKGTWGSENDFRFATSVKRILSDQSTSHA